MTQAITRVPPPKRGITLLKDDRRPDPWTNTMLGLFA